MELLAQMIEKAGKTGAVEQLGKISVEWNGGIIFYSLDDLPATADQLIDYIDLGMFN